MEQLVQHTVRAAGTAEIGARELANIAYGAGQAFAMMDQADTRLFAALAKEAERRMGNFKPQELANTAWAFAMLGQADAQLFTAFTRQADRCPGHFTP